MAKRPGKAKILIKFFNWEYWPVYITSLPIIFFWLYFAIRSRTLFFFSVVNPAIETGGVMGESKINILNQFPTANIPQTLFVRAEDKQPDQILAKLAEHKLSFPIVIKPNVGERGFLVEKIQDELELAAHLKKVNVDFLIQEFVDLPMEISVLYYRFPDEKQGKITSVCLKKNLEVTGDGQSSVKELMQRNPRAVLQIERLSKAKPELLKSIPKKGETLLLEPIGNHSRGTMFLNANNFISEDMTRQFDALALQFEGIYYGRFDMKCASVEQLERGEAYKVLEFNGVASEPAHIYDPEYPVWQAYRDIFQHWQVIYAIAQQQLKKGYKAMTLKEARQSLKEYFAYMQSAREYFEQV